MSQEKSTGTVYVVTEKSPQVQLFAEYLNKHTGCQISIHSPTRRYPFPLPATC